MSILANKLKPNLGQHQDPPTWKDIVTHFRGSALQTYFTRLLGDNLKAAIKPQHVERFAEFEQIPDNALVGEILAQKDEKNAGAMLAQQLDLTHLLQRKVSLLSGGE